MTDPHIPDRMPRAAASVPAAADGLDALRAEALAGGRAPRVRGIWYVTEHMVRTMRAYGWTIVVGALGQPILYLLGLAVGLAALIQAPVDDRGLSVPYLVYVAPALLMTAAISVATEEFTYPVMSGFTWRRHFYGFSASPLSPAQIAGGVVVGAAARMTLTVALYFGFIAAFFAVLHPGATNPATAWLMIPIGVLAGLSFGVPLLAYAASIRDDTGQFALVQRFVFVPMFLFSGTFYPLANLPGWVQVIGFVSPLWHASELGRAAAYGTLLTPLSLGNLLYLSALTVGGLLVARRLFTRRLTA